mmetsp:Transcript_2663/g.4477  ORF Transcript_2663/g.4477 Transcript_2663/m.4477 type:complete len:555 (-) Transcript_2663:285-1949(-)
MISVSRGDTRRAKSAIHVQIIVILLVDHHSGLVVELDSPGVLRGPEVLLQILELVLELLDEVHHFHLVGDQVGELLLREGEGVGDSDYGLEEVDEAELLIVEGVGGLDGLPHVVLVEFARRLLAFVILLLVVVLVLGPALLLVVLVLDNLLEDEDLGVLEEVDEVGLGDLHVAIALGHAALVEDGGEELEVLLEEALVAQIKHALLDLVILGLLLDVEVGVGEHGLQSVLEAVGVAGLVGVVLLEVGYSEDGLEELGVVEAVHDVERVLEGDGHAVDLVHALRGVGDLVLRPADVHDLEEVDEALEDDHGVLLAPELLLLDARVELEVLHQLLVVDREHAHRSIEVLLARVESQVHGFEEHLQLGRVLLLLRDLLLLLVPQPRLFLLQPLLRESGLLLPLLVLLLLLSMDLPQLLERDGLRLEEDSLIGLLVVGERLELKLLLLLALLIPEEVDVEGAVGEFEDLLVLPEALLVLEPIDLDLLTVGVVDLAELALQLGEHLVLDDCPNVALSLLEVLLDEGVEHYTNRHDVLLLSERLLVPVLLLLSLRSAPVL